MTFFRSLINQFFPITCCAQNLIDLFCIEIVFFINNENIPTLQV